MAKDDFELNEDTVSNARESINKLVKNLICLELDEIESYEFPTDKLFALEVTHRNALFYFIIKFSGDNKNFICFPPGASDRDKTTSSGELKVPPFFSRWKWHKYFDESTIALADPMLFLNDEIKLGWFIGVEDHWYLETASEIIKKLAVNQNVANENILFFGSSGGGYVSVCFATLIKNSKVVVNNAQFFILNYYPRLVNMAFKANFMSFNGLSQVEIINRIMYRLDTLELFRREKYAPHITYYVNVKSENDIINQTIPLLSSYYDHEYFNGLNLIYYGQDAKKPHNPLPNEITINIIKEYAKKNLYNAKKDPYESEFNIKNVERVFIDEKKAKKSAKKDKKSKKKDKNGKLKKFKRLFNRVKP